MSTIRQSYTAEYIERNLSGRLRVTDIARCAAVSPSHLSRLFRASFGVSVSTYIREQRSSRAAHLLRDTTQSISSIAASVGMPDLQAFNKFCRSQLGRSPSQLRRASEQSLFGDSSGEPVRQQDQDK